MKIILRIYKEIRIGNLSTMTLDIPNNAITVKKLKESIYRKYKIKPNEQKLTFKICHKKLITLTDNFPLSYFFIKDHSMIFLEIISNDPSEKSKNLKAGQKLNTAKFKYMNVLGYFLPDSKSLQRNQNLFGGFQNSFHKEKQSNSFNRLESDLIQNKSSKKSINSFQISEEESSSNSLIFVKNDESENNDLNKQNNTIDKTHTFSKKEDDEEEKISNNKLKRELSSNINNVEKLCLYIKKNDLENVKALIYQYSLDYNDQNSNESNNLNPSKLAKEGKTISTQNSQIKTNYKTTSSFNSGNVNCNSKILNNNICEILSENGWNAIHYSCYLGLEVILDYIVNKSNIKVNINVKNNEGWTPLLLAVYKQQIKCVEILMTLENIDINYVGPMGTALHIACKKNNRYIASKLLFKADPTLKDKYNKIALLYTHDKKIIKLISKVLAKKFESAEKNSQL